MFCSFLFYQPVIPALRRAQDRLTFGQAGIQRFYQNAFSFVSAVRRFLSFVWIPAFAGMTVNLKLLK
jgi:hypothetical protein